MDVLLVNDCEEASRALADSLSVRFGVRIATGLRDAVDQLVRRVPDGDLFRLVREAAPCRSATKEPAGLRATNPTRPGSSG